MEKFSRIQIDTWIPFNPILFIKLLNPIYNEKWKKMKKNEKNEKNEKKVIGFRLPLIALLCE